MGHLEVVRALLSAGALVNLATTDNASPLHVASVKGHLEVVRALLSAGALLNLRNTLSGRSPLFLACQHGHAEVALALVSAGGQLGLQDQGGWTPLQVACPQLRARLIQQRDAILATEVAAQMRLAEVEEAATCFLAVSACAVCIFSVLRRGGHHQA